jgi:hypothetical protein
MITVVGAVSAVIAVLGTLLGSALTYVFQRRSAERSENFSFQQQLRAERISAYTAFAVAASEFRRGQHDRWHRQDEDPDSAIAFNARIESYRLKGVALQALLQVQLVANDSALANLAKEAYERTTVLHRASTEAGLDVAGKETKEILENFIALGSHDVKSALHKNR